MREGEDASRCLMSCSAPNTKRPETVLIRQIDKSFHAIDDLVERVPRLEAATRTSAGDTRRSGVVQIQQKRSAEGQSHLFGGIGLFPKLAVAI
jgi:hypothetical protein